MFEITLEEVKEIISRVNNGEELFDMGGYMVFVPLTEPKSEALKNIRKSLRLDKEETSIAHAFASMVREDQLELNAEFFKEYGVIPGKEFFSFNPRSFSSPEAAEFIVAHELFHIALGHAKKFCLGDDFSSEEFIAKELEADFGAAKVTGHVQVALDELRRFNFDLLPPLRREEKQRRINQLETMLRS